MTKGGTRYYSQEQLNRFLGIKGEEQERHVIGYCRVSLKKQEDDLERQVENVREYMIAKGYQFEIITDISSGINYNNKGLNDFSLGIDLGINKLAATNIEGLEIKNINKTSRVRKLKKKLKRLQRQCSRKYEMHKIKEEGGEYRYPKTKNIIKIEKRINKFHSKLRHIKLNHIHQATNKMVKTKPGRVVMEDLNIKGMMKNKHLSEKITEQGLSMFISQMKYKCERLGIKFRQVPRFYPSSKTCSSCGSIKRDLRLSDRVYRCECGLEIDRDINASINLANYGLEKSM